MRQRVSKCYKYWLDVHLTYIVYFGNFHGVLKGIKLYSGPACRRLEAAHNNYGPVQLTLQAAHNNCGPVHLTSLAGRPNGKSPDRPDGRLRLCSHLVV